MITEHNAFKLRERLLISENSTQLGLSRCGGLIRVESSDYVKRYQHQSLFECEGKTVPVSTSLPSTRNKLNVGNVSALRVC